MHLVLFVAHEELVVAACKAQKKCLTEMLQVYNWSEETELMVNFHFLLLESEQFGVMPVVDCNEGFLLGKLSNHDNRSVA